MGKTKRKPIFSPYKKYTPMEFLAASNMEISYYLKPQISFKTTTALFFSFKWKRKSFFKQQTTVRFLLDVGNKIETSWSGRGTKIITIKKKSWACGKAKKNCYTFKEKKRKQLLECQTWRSIRKEHLSCKQSPYKRITNEKVGPHLINSSRCVSFGRPKDANQREMRD